jgi:hypothetical protein
VAKRPNQPYRPGERAWIKTKNKAYWRYGEEVERLIGAGGSVPVGTHRGHRERTKGENEALFRELNERLSTREQGATFPESRLKWICECEDEACTERIEMTRREYEELRADPTHFAVFPGEKHLSPDVERVVMKREAYWVVEKVGEAAETAEETDPR